MKTGFPLLNEKTLANNFAHAKFVGILDDEQKNITLVENTNQANFFQLLVQQNLKVVVSPTYSFMSLRVFNENGIVTFKATSTLLDDCVEQLQQGELQRYNNFDSYSQRDCSQGCSSCSTSSLCS